MQSNQITTREKEVLELVAQEHTTPEIASLLYLSTHTVDSHKKNLKSKLEAKTLAGLVRRGFELGLLRISSQSLALLGLLIILSISSIQVTFGQQEIELRTDGIVVPRLGAFEVTNPTAGQLIFDNDEYGDLMFYDGSNWQRLFTPVFENVNGLIRQTRENGELNQSFVFGASYVPTNLNFFNDTLFFFDQTNGSFGGGIFREIINNSSARDGAHSKSQNANAVAGQASFSYGLNTTATGEFAFAVGNNSSAEGFSSAVFNRDNIASGNYSTAFGNSTLAQGARSTAFGTNTQALNTNSVAFGELTEASGIRSVAFGQGTTASGTDAVAFGFTTMASGNHSVSFGNSTLASDPNTAAFGTESIANALNATAFGDSTVSNGVNAASFGSHTLATAENATAFGYMTHSSGENAIAVGKFSQASGESSTAIGINNQAVGIASFAAGSSNDAIGNQSFASGFDNKANVIGTTVFGYRNINSSVYSLVAGTYNDPLLNSASNPLSLPIFILGNGETESTRKNAMVVRYNGMVGINMDSTSARLGIATNSERNAPTMELHQTNEGGADSFVRQAFSNHSSNEKWFVVASPHNTPASGRLNFYHTDGSGGIDALKLFGDGDATIGKDLTVEGSGTSVFKKSLKVDGDLTVDGNFTNPSDIRYKKDIIPLDGSLSSILKLGGYRYNWKDNNKPEPQIGLIAQEVQAVYPELVKENDEGMLSVSYTKMVPVLLEAIKEQQEMIESLKDRIEKLENQ